MYKRKLNKDILLETMHIVTRICNEYLKKIFIQKYMKQMRCLKLLPERIRSGLHHQVGASTMKLSKQPIHCIWTLYFGLSTQLIGKIRQQTLCYTVYYQSFIRELRF